MNHWRIRLLILMFLAAAAGCGGDDTTSSEPATASGSEAASSLDSESASASGSGPDSASSSSSEPSDEESSSSQATGGENTEAVRIVASVYGEVEVPAEPERLVALDEYVGASLLGNGAEPVATFAPFRARIPIQLLSEAGVPVTEYPFGEVPFEQVAAQQPDMIVITDVGDPALIETLSEIAPTVAVPFVAPWREITTALGGAAGADGDGAGLIGTLDSRIAELGAGVDDGETISILATGPQFGTYTLGVGGVASTLLDEIGYGRPDAELAPPDLGASLSISPENLVDHDATHIVQLDGDESFFSAQQLRDLPTFQAIPAVQDGRTSVALGEIWTSSDPFSVYWILEDLAAIQAGGSPATIDDVAERWEAFKRLAG